MPIPTSLSVVLLVVAWLAVLVPMVAKRREHVPDTDEGTSKHFRVLRRASASLRRRPKFRPADEDIDESDVGELEPEDDLEEVLLDNEHDIDHADEPEREPARVLVKERQASRRDEVDEDAEYDQEVEYVEEESVEYLEEEYDSVDEEAAYDEYEDEHLEDPRYRPVPRRHGRGGYDPEAAERTRAYRYSRRRKVSLVLLLATLAGAAIAYLLTPTAWYATAVCGLLLVAYLTYLRRQVRIEEDIRQRRMARLRRARQIRPEYTRSADGAEQPAGSQVPEVARAEAATVAPRVGRGRRRPVEFDDDDPAFDELEYYQPVAYRRAAGQ